jgi:hypothetical protein
MIPKENSENKLHSGHKGGQKEPRNPRSPRNPKNNNGLGFLFSPLYGITPRNNNKNKKNK